MTATTPSRPGAGLRPGRLALLLALLLAAALPASGQPPAAPPAPPAPPAPEEPPPPPRLEASAQLTFLDTRGNTSAQSLGAGGEVTWRPEPWTLAAKAAFAQNESDGELDARSLSGLLRGSRALGERLSVYGQYDYLRDVFAGVEQRHVLEAGLSYLALEAPRHTLRLDGGLGYIYEERPEEELDSATLALGAAYRVAISPTSEFTYQPRYLLPLSETDAWKLDQEAALAVAINTALALKVSHTLRYSAAPPEGFDTTDTIMAVSLVAKLQRPR